MLNPIEKFKRSILHLNRSLHHSVDISILTKLTIIYGTDTNRFLGLKCPYSYMFKATIWGSRHSIFHRAVALKYTSMCIMICT